MITVPVKSDGVEYIEVRPISFVRYAELSGSIAGVERSDRLKNLQRQRLLIQCKAFGENSTELEVTDAFITSLPFKIGRELVNASNLVLSVPGEGPKLLSAEGADGITAAVHVKLAQPLKAKGDEITELEFQAKTFGDIEAAFAEPNSMMQTAILVQSVARPVLSSIKLQRLPSWAVDQLSVVDGSFIAEHVTPHFLG